MRSLSCYGAKAVAISSLFAGARPGGAGAAGAGLLARSEQNVIIRWEDVRKIKVRPGRRFVLIRGGWADKPIGLYCTPENFAQVMDILRTHAGTHFSSLQKDLAAAVP